MYAIRSYYVSDKDAKEQNEKIVEFFDSWIDSIPVYKSKFQTDDVLIMGVRI